MSISDPPHDSPLRVLELDALERRRRLDREALVAADGAAPRAPPVSVRILNTEPGGCGAEKATPASASTSPVRGRTAAIPP